RDALRIADQPLRDFVLRQRDVAVELGREHLVTRARDAEADLAVRGGERLHEACRIRGARSARYAEEDAQGPILALWRPLEKSRACAGSHRRNPQRTASASPCSHSLGI